VSHHAAIVELLAGDPVAAERSLRSGYEALEAMGDRAFLSTTAAFLGQALVAQGRPAEAEEMSVVSAELAAGDDLLTQSMWRGVRAQALASRGDAREAERLAREAIALAQGTDFLNLQADARADLALVLRGDEARAAMARAVALYERKGNAAAVRRLRARVAAPTRL
jgi:hypothetical protein